MAVVLWLVWAGRRWSATVRRGAWLVWGVGWPALLGVTAGLTELRKAASLCLMPLGLVWMGLGVLAVTAWAGRRHRLAAAAAVLWFGLSLAANVPVGVGLMRLLEAPYAGIDPFAQGRFDAVIVLGGGVREDSSGRIVVEGAGDRAVLAARLYNAGVTPLLVATGPVRRDRDGRRASYPDAVRRLWAGLGVPAAAVLAVEGPRSTSEEIAVTAPLVRQRGWRRVGLVTSAWHLRRALGLCRRAGMDVVPLPADFLGDTRIHGFRALIPEEDGVVRVQLACWELLGAFAGR